jgi:hypothetical protein
MNQHGPEYTRWLTIHNKETNVSENNNPETQLTVAIAEPSEPAVYSLIVPTATLEAYRDQTLTEAKERVSARKAAVALAEHDVKVAEVNRQLAVDAKVVWQEDIWRGRLQGARSRVTRARNTIKAAEDFLELVESGYLPIPRLPAVDVHRLADPLPMEALMALKSEQDKGVFTEFAVVGGRDRWAQRRGRRALGRDPILVGVCDGEMFPLAWWR